MMLNFTPTDAMPVAGSAKDDEELVERLTAFIDTLAKADQFSGSVLVTHNGKTLLQTSRGRANKSFDAPNRTDTKFNLASMNKMFTAVAIAQLEERGKLSYDDPIGKHLPDYANEVARSKVTIHQLLTHTSGLGGDIFAPPGTPVRTIDQIIAQFVNEPLRFEPGTQFAYCNAGFVVLGKIVERASGMDYYEYVRENIYKPAGMVDTDCYAIDTPVPNLAIGYTRFRDGDASSAATQPANQKADDWYCNTLLHSARGGPAGGGCSTVEDLQRFADALANGKLLKPESGARLTTGKVDMSDSVGGKMRYGYGFIEKVDRHGHRAFSHEGTFYGISTGLYVYPEEGYVLAVLSNYDRGAVPIIARFSNLIPARAVKP